MTGKCPSGAHLLQFITGHSLGGALAVVATRFIDAHSIAACYTYGCPRVGDLELAKVFKSPIYRHVNAADVVPRLPFGYGYILLLKLLKLVTSVWPQFAILEKLYGYLDMMTGYTHYGDQRYLTAVEPSASDTYPGLDLISNPGFFLLLGRFLTRAVATRGKALMDDHSIGIYRAKLRARAETRPKHRIGLYVFDHAGICERRIRRRRECDDSIHAPDILVSCPCRQHQGQVAARRIAGNSDFMSGTLTRRPVLEHEVVGILAIDDCGFSAVLRHETVVDREYGHPTGVAQRRRNHAVAARTADGKSTAVHIKESPVMACIRRHHPLGSNPVGVSRSDFAGRAALLRPAIR